MRARARAHAAQAPRYPFAVSSRNDGAHRGQPAAAEGWAQAARDAHAARRDQIDDRDDEARHSDAAHANVHARGTRIDDPNAAARGLDLLKKREQL
jgi:hypothetical protein